MKYYLHTINSDEEGFARLSSLAHALKNSPSDPFELDLSRCIFFDANMAAALAATLSYAEGDFEIRICSATPSVERILRKNLFLTSYGYGTLEDTNHTTLPFVKMGLSDTTSFAGYLSTHMNGKGIPRMSTALEKAFRQSIFEILANCVTHSESIHGIFVCGQYYPQDHRLDLTISDAGVGIRTKVRRHLRDNKISSIDAIRWALKQGHTTKTGSQPGGMGLTLLRDFIALNGGKIQIASRQGYYQFQNETENFVKLTSDFPGTTVNFEINTNDTHVYQLTSESTSNNVF